MDPSDDAVTLQNEGKNPTSGFENRNGNGVGHVCGKNLNEKGGNNENEQVESGWVE